MKKVYQKSDNDCFNSCIASMLELKYEEVPVFRLMGKNMFDNACHWLLAKGYKVRLSQPQRGAKYLSRRELLSFKGDVLAGLDMDGVCHAIVVNNAELVHDPLSPDKEVDMTRILNVTELVKL